MTATAAELLREATAELAPLIGTDAASREARLILRHVTGWTGAGLSTRLRDAVGEYETHEFHRLIRQRARRRSLAHVLGRTEFFGRDFVVGPGDLAPRPDTETLVELALGGPFSRLLDLGTGTGVIAVTLLAERPQATGLATDLTEANLQSARANAVRAGVADRLDFAVSDWFGNLSGRFDLIVSNPPYVSEAAYSTLAPEIQTSERREALTPGGDGLAPYRAIARDALRFLEPGGRLIVEIGFDQGAEVASLFRAAGLRSVAVYPDIDGRDRVVIGTAPS